MVERTVSASASYVYSDIFALPNPAGGSGSLAIAGSFRSVYANAFTVSGVSTAVSSGTYGSNANAATTSVTLSNTTAANSFAVTAQGDRLGTLNGFNMTATSGSPQIQWFKGEGTGNLQDGGGYVANLAAGASTITNSAATTSRNTLGVAVFTPLVAASSAMTWVGTASANWDVDATKELAESPARSNYLRRSE